MIRPTEHPHASLRQPRMTGRKTAPRSRRGQSLVEFALVALVVYMLLAAILTFGHALYVAQGLQTAVDVGSREISRTPLPANITLDNPADDPEPGALHHDDVRSRIFDEAFLVIDLNAFYASDPNANFFQDAVPQLPLLNQQLATLMIVDRPDFNGDGTADAWLLRYPGALLTRSTAIAPPTGVTYPSWVATDYAVGIPVVTSRAVPGPGAVGGFETIRWVPVVEEIDSESSPGDNTAPNPDPFKLVQDDPANIDHRGIVALRINYPFQSASMSSFRASPAGSFEPTLGFPNAADDDEVTELNPSERPGDLTGAPLSDGEHYAGTYGGQYGLGAQGAMGSEYFTGGRPVRPYRRVISAQAIYRREVFR
ncbi:MAG: pilus biosynthesis protein TadE [Pirellulaceae bacterium]|nr:MAG: pilus biosynthesis protein TadE [Pirellulaceae bacterium]